MRLYTSIAHLYHKASAFCQLGIHLFECSHVNLQQMAAVCKPSGQIILLQHGKATWDWLNQRLDDEAPAHHLKWGCWWNRDILQIAEQVGTCLY